MENPTVTYADWLKMYPWEGFLTVRLPPTIKPTESHPAIVRDVLRPLALFLRSRIGALTVTSFGHGQHRPHLHILLLSKSRQLAANILEAEAHLRGLRSPVNTHRDAIDLRLFREEHPQYTAKHLIRESDLNWYDRRLLKRYENKEKIRTP